MLVTGRAGRGRPQSQVVSVAGREGPSAALQPIIARSRPFSLHNPPELAGLSDCSLKGRRAKFVDRSNVSIVLTRSAHHQKVREILGLLVDGREGRAGPRDSEEAERVSQRAAELSGVQDRKRTGDIVATKVAVVVFWPTAFLVNGDDAQTAELARLKGEFETIQQVSIRKSCATRFQAQLAPPPRRATAETPSYAPH